MEPKNPYNAIIDSVPISKRSTGRIGVDFENKELVMFKKMLENTDGRIIYHGYTVKWDELKQPQKNALQEAGLVKRNGKIE